MASWTRKLTELQNIIGAAAILLASFSTQAGTDDRVIYRSLNDGRLLAYQFNGMENGDKSWAKTEEVGAGWNKYRTIFTAAGGYVYAIDNGGVLYWYRHDGQQARTKQWTGPKKIGSGWHFKTVFAAENGVIYAINARNELVWYQHTGRRDGTPSWKSPGKVVGTGWGFKHVFGGSDGAIYAIGNDGTLWWYKHLGRSDGTVRWKKQKVATGWQQYTHIFAAPQGVILAIRQNGELVWNRHIGYQDGTAKWDTAKVVGTGWLNNPFVASTGVELSNISTTNTAILLPSNTATISSTLTTQTTTANRVLTSQPSGSLVISLNSADELPNPDNTKEVTDFLLAGYGYKQNAAPYVAVIEELIALNNTQTKGCTAAYCKQLKLAALKVLLVQKIMTLADTSKSWTVAENNLMTLMKMRQESIRASYAWHLKYGYAKAMNNPCPYDPYQNGCSTSSKYATLLQGGPTLSVKAVQKIMELAGTNYINDTANRTDMASLSQTAALGLLIDTGLKMLENPKKIEDIPPAELKQLVAATSVVKQVFSITADGSTRNVVEILVKDTSPKITVTTEESSVTSQKVSSALAAASVLEGGLQIANAAISIHTANNDDLRKLTDKEKAALGLTIVSGSTTIIGSSATLVSNAATTGSKLASVTGKVGSVAGVAGGVAGVATGILQVIDGSDTNNAAGIATGSISIVSGASAVVSGVASTATAFGAASTVASTASMVAGPINILALAATIATTEGARVFGNIDAQTDLYQLINDSQKPLSMVQFRKSITNPNGTGMVLSLTALSKDPVSRGALPKYETWIGTAPFCEGEVADCTKRGLKYKSFGDSGCASGRKVLCAVE